MRVQLNGASSYAAEQSLLGLLPEEPIVYGEPSGSRWLSLETQTTDGQYQVLATMSWDGTNVSHTLGTALSGTAYQQEGQRRRCLGLCIFHAVQKATGIQPVWGSLTGVRPGKLAARILSGTGSPQSAAEILTKQYCVAPERARMAVEAAEIGIRAMDDLSRRDIAVYIGIPFCPTRCAYCSFVSQSVERSFALVEPYVDALSKEIKSAGRLARERGLRVRTLYMGGGTPTTLTASQLDRLLTCLEQSFPPCMEFTVEAGRPDTITAEKLSVLRDHGVTRLSVNPQTMEDSVLQAIGRRHTSSDIERVMPLVEEYGFRHVNMDLIAGLPSDTPDGFRRSLDRCLSFGTDNLTVHTLSLKRGSAITRERQSIPDAQAVGEMLDYAAPVLRQAGYTPYYLYRQKYMSGSFENVGWSCGWDGVCLYNVYMMEELCSVLSLGAGGATKMIDFDTKRITRTFNVKYPKEYVERPEKWQANHRTFAAFYGAA